jgi:hypothetical protein
MVAHPSQPRLFVFGGTNAAAAFNQLHVLELDRLRWTEMQCGAGQPPSARVAATMVVWEDAHDEMHSLTTPYLVVYGGSSFDQTAMTDVHTFNLNTGRWSRLKVRAPGGWVGG